MNATLRWIAIGLLSGTVLAVALKIPQLLWDIPAYNLLFDVSYIPIANAVRPEWIPRSIFHFTTCICSLAILYQLLHLIDKAHDLLWYTLVIGLGSTALYFLTLLGHNTPQITDTASWIWWTLGHVLFSITGWYLIGQWFPAPRDSRPHR